MKGLKKVPIRTNDSPSFPEICSQALKVGDFVFVGGVIPVSPETGKVVSQLPGEQADQMLTHLESILKAAGTDLHSVIQVTLYVRDWREYPDINAAYCRRFAAVDPLPVRATVEVAYIGADSTCELEAIALVEGDKE